MTHALCQYPQKHGEMFIDFCTDLKLDDIRDSCAIHGGRASRILCSEQTEYV